MEGASWIAKKAHAEIERHIQRLQALMLEYSRKQKECIIDEKISEVNGREILKSGSWFIE